jgi:hypothetical protein
MNPLASWSIREWGTATIAVVLVITAIGFNKFNTSAQEQGTDPRPDRANERIIEKGTNSAVPNEPVEITLAKTKKGVVKFGKPFNDEDNDWLKGFTLTAKNIYHKAITYIDVTYSFERPKDDVNRDQLRLVDTLTYGRLASKPGDMQLKPGESTDLVLTDSRHDFLKNVLVQAGYPPSIKHIKFYLAQVIFEDGTMWSLGYWYRRDPTNAENWIPVVETGKEVGSRRGGPGANKLLFRNHAAKVEPDSSIGGLSSSPSLQNPCQDPGFPAWVTCEGGPNDNCKRKFQPTLPSQITHTHRDLNTLTVCKQCVNPTPSTLECDSGLPCTNSFVPTTLPEVCPTPTPTPTPTPGSCQGVADFTTYPSTGCASGFTVIGGVCTRSLTFQSRCAGPTYYDAFTCSCPDGVDPSPILIDVDHTGFAMTSAMNGVVFDILNDGIPIKLAWTGASSTNAFLTIDLNGNGRIDNGTELFGDLSPQPPSQEPNGFSALAQYDRRTAGGNENGKIDSGDVVFGRLLLWRDANHNGISETNEMRGLGEYGIEAIDLKFHESRWVDQFGNQFRYRGKVYYARGLRSERWAWDVFLKVN